MAVPLGALDPADRVGIRGGAKLAAGDAAKVVGDDVVVAHAIAFAVDAVEEINELDEFDVEAGFLADFAHDAGGKRFADFKHASGQRPVALEGLTAAAHEEHAAILDDDCAHTDEGGCWEFALDYVFHATNHSATPRGPVTPRGAITLRARRSRATRTGGGIARTRLSSNRDGWEGKWLNSR